MTERDSPDDVITRFMADNNLVFRDFGDLVNEELSRREFPPRSLTYMTLNNWAEGRHRPNSLIFEWLSKNAKDERLRELGRDVLEAMAQ